MTEQEERALQIIHDAIRQAGAFDEGNILKILQERVASNYKDVHDVAAVIWILAKELADVQIAAEAEIKTLKDKMGELRQLVYGNKGHSDQLIKIIKEYGRQITEATERIRLITGIFKQAGIKLRTENNS